MGKQKKRIPHPPPADFRSFPPTQAQIDFILDNITEQENGCWIWNGKTSSNRKTRLAIILSDDGVELSVRRLLYQSLTGPVERSQMVRSLCGTPLCVNPDAAHCWVVGTQQCAAHGKVHCVECQSAMKAKYRQRQRESWAATATKYWEEH